jgi:quercetin dioxygenase-like cupin family protein
MVQSIRFALLAATSILLPAQLPAAFAQSDSRAAFTPVTELKWTDTGIPGVTRAAVAGQDAKGPSHFYLKYAAGFVAPVHHHSPDHYATTVTGNLVLVVDGKERRLAPGSYFAFTGKANHSARCEGTQDCVMFIDARGPWDVVAAKANSDK